MRRARIICTMGPSTRSEERIEALILAGMDVARLNFSHGDHEDHRATYDTIRRVSARLQRPVAILQDLQGPKIRVGRFVDGSTELVEGQPFNFVAAPIQGDNQQVSITYPELCDEVRVGEEILLDDGLLRVRITGVHSDRIETEVVIGGTLKNNKGMNLPNTAFSAPALTAKDKEDLEFGLSLGVDYVALSFVRSSLDVHQLRCLIPDTIDPPAIIAKIEKPQAIEKLREIVEAADGIMVARGDLGVEMPPEMVPMIQKRALDLARRRGRIAIIATQMLESMTENPRPTRAEASDVANAIYDGADAVMLSGETAVGRYPVEVVEMMSRIVEHTEDDCLARDGGSAPPTGVRLSDMSTAIANAATIAADDLKVSALCCFTISGRTARRIRSLRPSRDIIAFTPSLRRYNQMALYWGVTPILGEFHDDPDTVVEHVENKLKAQGIADDGDHIIITMGVPVGTDAPTNLIRFHTLGYRPACNTWASGQTPTS